MIDAVQQEITPSKTPYNGISSICHILIDPTGINPFRKGPKALPIKGGSMQTPKISHQNPLIPLSLSSFYSWFLTLASEGPYRSNLRLETFLLAWSMSASPPAISNLGRESATISSMMSAPFPPVSNILNWNMESNSIDFLSLWLERHLFLHAIRNDAQALQ